MEAAIRFCKVGVRRRICGPACQGGRGRRACGAACGAQVGAGVNARCSYVPGRLSAQLPRFCFHCGVVRDVMYNQPAPALRHSRRVAAAVPVLPRLWCLDATLKTMMLWLIFALMTAAAVLPCCGRSGASRPRRAAAAIGSSIADQLQEIDRDRAAGMIGAAEAEVGAGRDFAPAARCGGCRSCGAGCTGGARNWPSGIAAAAIAAAIVSARDRAGLLSEARLAGNSEQSAFARVETPIGRAIDREPCRPGRGASCAAIPMTARAGR